MDSRLTILTVNAVAYTLAALFFLKRTGLSVGLVIWCVFAVSAWGSVMLVVQPDFYGTVHDNPIPGYNGLAYLFVVLLLFIYPMTKIRKAEPGKLIFPHPEAIPILIYFAIFIMLIFIVTTLPRMGEVMSGGASSLVDYRMDAYDEDVTGMSDNRFLRRINEFFSYLPQMCYGISLYLLLCYDRNRGLVRCFFFTTLVCLIVSTIVNVSRANMVITMLVTVMLLVYMRDFLSKRFKRAILFYGLPAIAVIISFFWAISVSRFEDLANFMIFKYLGEPMVNFAGILYPDITGFGGGAVYFQPITVLFTGVANYSTTLEKWEFVEGLTGITPEIFYTFVGALVIDFGFIMTFLIACFFCWAGLSVARSSRSGVSFGAFIIINLLIYAYSGGVFFFSVQGSGLFMIIYSAILGYYFKKPSYDHRLDNIPPRP